MNEAELSSPTVSYTSADLATVIKVTRKPWVRTLLSIMLVVCAAVTLLLAVMLVVWNEADAEAVWLLVTYLAVTAFLIALAKFGDRFLGWLVYVIGKRDGLYVDQHFALLTEAFEAISERGTSTLKWSAVPRLEVIDERLLVFLSKRQAFVVPRRAFSSEADFKQFARAATDLWKAARPPIAHEQGRS